MSKLKRKPDHRNHLVRNMVTSLVLYESVKTTDAKSKLLVSEFDRLISRAKKSGIEDRKYVMGYLFDKNAYKKIYDVILPRYKDVRSGYTKKYRLGERLGDNSKMVLVSLSDKKKKVERSK